MGNKIHLSPIGSHPYFVVPACPQVPVRTRTVWLGSRGSRAVAGGWRYCQARTAARDDSEVWPSWLCFLMGSWHPALAEGYVVWHWWTCNKIEILSNVDSTYMEVAIHCRQAIHYLTCHVLYQFIYLWCGRGLLNQLSQLINSLWPSHAKWWHRSGSTLAPVMTWCLTAPNHNQHHCWLIIKHFYCIYLRAIAREINLWNVFGDYRL